MPFSNTEFYNSPGGDVYYKIFNQPVRVLSPSDRSLIMQLLEKINDRYPEAFKALAELYSRYEKNRTNYEFRMVHRFIRCNFGEYDHQDDIASDGHFCLEEVRCPLRGECIHEGIICKPKFDRKLTDREMDVLKLISQGLRTNEIAAVLSISALTVNRHRENIKSKLQVRTIAEMVKYYCQFENRNY